MNSDIDPVALVASWARLWESYRRLLLCHPDRVQEVKAAVERAWLAMPIEVRGSALVARDQVVVADPDNQLRELREDLAAAHVRRELVPLVRTAAKEVPLPAGRIEVARGLLRTHRTADQALFAASQEQWAEAQKELQRRVVDEVIQAQILALAAELGLPHGENSSCWCRPVRCGPVLVHQDARVPPGHLRQAE
ncbi:hypothetical protein [Saccharothrix xinjiangensis]|uniref:Uncharacterized protein n=1 Tax=Saccharothrix xinjiangensis TaxID=204798 RepID=A0ABV9XVY8_9PSEU